MKKVLKYVIIFVIILAIIIFGINLYVTMSTSKQIIKEKDNFTIKGYQITINKVKTEDEEEVRKAFKLLKEQKDKYNLNILSMGMTNDYKIAISEGSNLIRIGTKIFGPRDYSKNK